MLRHGATDEEVRGEYQGADVIPGGRRGATMATTVEARPSEIWPWLVQMGCDRAGWYSWDRLDNGGKPSASRIHPEWQQIAIGDRMASLPDGSAWFEVAALEPERFLGLRATLDLRGTPLDPRGLKARVYTDSLWCFQLRELPGNRTRLVISGYDASVPRPFHAVMNFLFWEPAHWIMQTRQFSNLRQRVAATATP
jgi:proline iminopeptidase